MGTVTSSITDPQQQHTKLLLYIVLTTANMMKYMVLAALLVAGCAASDPVKADLYFEGLCGGCHQFYLDTLFPTWKQIGSIMDIGLYAYGNAYRTNTSSGSWKFTRQHLQTFI